ncbi:VanZ family protein [Virgibacillus xinjiangensis]|uniref:VanZ family protein n=1 Tax=Virgibacillus xinjiangensis TaxID=393090 RepID=A0ABV7CY69_9BACI
MLLFSFSIEILQYVTQLGVFDVDDIILNTLGGYLGFLIFVLFKNRIRLFH